MIRHLTLLSYNYRHHARPLFEAVHAAAVSSEALTARLCAAGFGEVAALVTCNRVEVVVNDARGAEAHAAIEALLVPAAWREGGLVAQVSHGAEAVRWLTRVTAGTESMALGEPQIVGQVKGAYDAACAQGSAGRSIHFAFQSALRVAKLARNGSGVGAGRLSLASLAAGLVVRHFEAHGVSPVTLLGAGQMARSVALELTSRGVRVAHVVNRGHERGAALARELGAGFVPLADWLVAPVVGGVVVSVLGCDRAIAEADALAAHRTVSAPLLVVDLGMPASVSEPLQAQHVEWHGLYELEEAARDHRRRREAARGVARQLIDQGLRADHEKLRVRHFGPHIARARARLEAAFQAEADKVYGGALRELTPAQRREVERQMRALRNRVKHLVTLTLRDMALALSAMAETQPDAGEALVQRIELLFDERMAELVARTAEGREPAGGFALDPWLRPLQTALRTPPARAN